MILLKILLTVSIVFALSLIAERISPRAAGILSGYPLGSAISLFFIGLEQSPQYAGASAVYNIAGLAASMSFFFFYYHASIRLKHFDILAGSLAGLAAFFTMDSLLQLLTLPAWASVLIAATAMLAATLLFRRIPNVQIARRVRLGPRVMLFRATLATLIILAIIGAAHLVPPNWAGLFSAFPAVVFPLLLIIHSTYGAQQAHTILKNMPTGLWALMFYSLTISFSYPRFGIYWGTLMGFAVATLYLLGFASVSSALSRRAASAQESKKYGNARS